MEIKTSEKEISLQESDSPMKVVAMGKHLGQEANNTLEIAKAKKTP